MGEYCSVIQITIYCTVYQFIKYNGLESMKIKSFFYIKKDILLFTTIKVDSTIVLWIRIELDYK